MQYLSLFLILSFLLFSSCAKDDSSVEIIEEKEIKLQMIDAYNEGLDALENQDGLTAAKNLAKQNYYFHNQLGHPNLL